ncbi:hypothetical protein RUM43_000403 [Polyplax serrata]|uniref:Uncharacterized protein n=1 Tax=Polyplax serrata TaxID=468196 RepID=A0AAN8SDZ4_POLSC
MRSGCLTKAQLCSVDYNFCLARHRKAEPPPIKLVMNIMRPMMRAKKEMIPVEKKQEMNEGKIKKKRKWRRKATGNENIRSQREILTWA